MAVMALFLPFVLGLIEPGFLLFYAVEAYVKTLAVSLYREQRIPQDLRGKAFGEFWSKISPGPPDPTVALAGSMALAPGLFSLASGNVLEIGPGSGNQTLYYEPAAEHIRAIYGAEPAKELHNMLKANVMGTKLASKYKILSADANKASIARELSREGVIKTEAAANGIFTTIVAVRVLCSVPNLDRVVEDLHSLLRPGGRLLILEHTVNPWRTAKGSLVARLVQSIYMFLGWKYFVGDCSLVVDTESALRKDAAQRWDSIDIERHFSEKVLTYISGTLVKK